MANQVVEIGRVHRLPWEQMVGEPDEWFDRFSVFRALGLLRTIRRTYEFMQSEDPDNFKARYPGPAWMSTARKWDWFGRAKLYDQAQADDFRSREQQIMFERRVRRLQMIQDMELKAFKALDAARLDQLSLSEARNLLPQTRMLLLSLLSQERVEFGGPDEKADAGKESVEVDGYLQRELARIWGARTVSIGEDE